MIQAPTNVFFSNWSIYGLRGKDDEAVAPNKCETYHRCHVNYDDSNSTRENDHNDWQKSQPQQ